MTAEKMKNDRLLSVLHKLCARGLRGDWSLAQLEAFNRMQAKQSFAFFGGSRSPSGSLGPMCAEMKLLFDRLDSGNRTLVQLEAIANLSQQELRLVLPATKVIQVTDH